VNKWLYKRVASLERDGLLVFKYHSVSEIWPDKEGSLWWEWSYKGCILYHTIMDIQTQPDLN